MTIVGAPTLVWVNPGTTASLIVIRALVSQYGTTTSQQMGVQFFTQASVFPTVVAATPDALSITDPASKITGGTGAAGTCGINSSAQGAGTQNAIWQDSFNNLNGWLWIPTPDERITLPAGSNQGLGIQLLNTPTSLVSWQVGLAFMEV